jgi:hypothetical protein
MSHSKRPPKANSVFNIKSPQRRGQYTLFEINHNLGDSRTT